MPDGLAKVICGHCGGDVEEGGARLLAAESAACGRGRERAQAGSGGLRLEQRKAGSAQPQVAGVAFGRHLGSQPSCHPAATTHHQPILTQALGAHHHLVQRYIQYMGQVLLVGVGALRYGQVVPMVQAQPPPPSCRRAAPPDSPELPHSHATTTTYQPPYTHPPLQSQAPCHCPGLAPATTHTWVEEKERNSSFSAGMTIEAMGSR